VLRGSLNKNTSPFLLNSATIVLDEAANIATIWPCYSSYWLSTATRHLMPQRTRNFRSVGHHKPQACGNRIRRRLNMKR